MSEEAEKQPVDWTDTFFIWQKEERAKIKQGCTCRTRRPTSLEDKVNGR